jgi:hypothetical protein
MLELGIGGNDLLAYALVYGFCQDGKSCYQGSYEYIARWLNCNRCTVVRIVARLADAGLFYKEEKYVNGVKFCNLYAIVPAVVQNATPGCKMQPSWLQNATGGGSKMQQHNNSGHSDIDRNREKENIKERNFNFRNSLINAGASAEVADQWLEVRRNKRLTNTELALADTLKEIRKAGLTVDAALRECVIRSWGGFKAEWLEREQNGGSRGARPEKLSGTAYMIQQMERRQRDQQGYDPNDLPDEQ